jgi:hypothetical protein
MKKEIFLSIILVLVLFSCDSGNCSDAYFKQQSCHIIVTDNINKSSHWGGGGRLKFKGIDLVKGEEVLYKSKTRVWRPLSDYINIGDTVVKNEGEIIMYVYKKDSIVKMNLSKICKEDFDLRKDVYTFILRDTIK